MPPVSAPEKHQIPLTYNLLVASGGSSLKLLDVDSPRLDLPCVVTANFTSSVSCVRWNHTNAVVASAGGDGMISLTHVSGDSLGSISDSSMDAQDPKEFGIAAICFSKGSRYIVSGGASRDVRVWDLKKKQCVKTLTGHTAPVTGVSYNYGDQMVASVSEAGDLLLHSQMSGVRVAELRAPKGAALRTLCYSPHRKHLLATGGDDGSVYVWDTTARTIKMPYHNRHAAPVTAVAFSPTNQMILCSAGLDKRLLFLDLADRSHSMTYEWGAPLTCLAMRGDGVSLAAGTTDGQVILFDIRKGAADPVMRTTVFAGRPVTSLHFQHIPPKPEASSKVDTSAVPGFPLREPRGYGDDETLMGTDAMDAPMAADPQHTRTVVAKHVAPGGAHTEGGRALAVPDVASHRDEPAGVDHAGDLSVFSPVQEVKALPTGMDVPAILPTPLLSSLAGGMAGSMAPLSSRATPGGRDSGPAEGVGAGTFARRLEHQLDEVAKSKSSTTPLSEAAAAAMAFAMSSPAPPQHKSAAPAAQAAGPAPAASQRAAPRPAAGAGGSALPGGEAVPGVARDGLSLGGGTGLLVSGTNTGGTNTGGTNTGDGVARQSAEMEGAIGPPARVPSFTAKGSMAPPPPAAAATTVPSSASQPQNQNPYVAQLVRHAVDESLGSFRKSVHDEIQNLHLELLRQFHIQQTDIAAMVEGVMAKQNQLLEEIDALRRENQQLKYMY
eukprot:jgi/Mesvir1/13136/Mv06107-RA.1